MLDIQLLPFPNLSTQRLQLRQITEEDVNDYYSLRSNKRVTKYLDMPELASAEAALQLIRKITAFVSNNESITWAITLKEDNRLIGTILYKKIDKDHHRAEVGYMLHPDHWRKGIVQEALTAVLDHGFTIFNFHSIEALVNPDNAASISLLEKNKFVREAYYKENYYFEGQFLDTGVYSLLKSNYK